MYPSLLSVEISVALMLVSGDGIICTPSRKLHRAVTTVRIYDKDDNDDNDDDDDAVVVFSGLVGANSATQERQRPRSSDLQDTRNAKRKDQRDH